MKNEDYEVLAQKIVELFPTECSETYYVAPKNFKYRKNNKKSAISKGKIVDKYRNKRSFILSVEKKKVVKAVTPSTSESGNFDITTNIIFFNFF